MRDSESRMQSNEIEVPSLEQRERQCREMLRDERDRYLTKLFDKGQEF